MNKLINDLVKTSNAYGYLIGYLESAEETRNPNLSVVLDALRKDGRFPKSKYDKITFKEP